MIVALLENWLSSPWLCWGIGPVIAVNCGVYLTAFALELAIYSGVSMISYGNRSRKDALAKEPSFNEQLLEALKLTIGPTTILNAFLLTKLMAFLEPEPYPLFPNGLLLSILKLLLMLVMNDFLLYWGHRIQHENEFLWKFHAVHHSCVTPRPLTVGIIHPIDVTLQNGLPIVTTTIICRPHPWLLYAFIFLRISDSVMNHCGSDSWLVVVMKGSWLPLRAGVEHHDRHHLACNKAEKATNYAESFIIWDWMFGTLSQSK